MRRKRLKQIRDFYRVCWPVRLLRPADGLGRPAQIVTIRHARPDLAKASRYTAPEVTQYFQDYDAAPIVSIEEPTFVLDQGEVGQVYCSSLIRSIATARALFGTEQQLVIDSQFRELERAVPERGWLSRRRWSLSAWQLLSRGSYLLGAKMPGIESFRDGRTRIATAARFLEQRATEDGAAVLVAHGFFNFFLGRKLRRRGWRRVRRSGRDYLGVAVYVR